MTNIRLHLYIIDQISPGTQYGIGTYINQLINIWQNKYASCLTIIKLGADVSLIEEVWSEGIRYLWLPACDEEEDSPLLAESILQCIDLNERNIFHFNYSHHFFFAKELKRLVPKCKLIITIHYFKWCFMTNGNTDIFKTALKKNDIERNEAERILYKDFVFTKAFFELSNKVICLSTFARDLLINIYRIDKSKVKLIFNALPDEAAYLQKETFSSTPVKKERILLFVGRLVEQKGVIFLIKAFRILLQRHKNIHLLLVGNGDYDRLLCECEDIWQHITFTGNIKKQKIYQLYRQVDIGILPSFNEQCSYVMIEMMMHGLPVVATDSTGLSEMVEEGYNGYKAHIEKSTSDPNAFTGYLVQALDNILSLPQESLDRMRRNSRKSYLSKYTIEMMEDKIRELWTS